MKLSILLLCILLVTTSFHQPDNKTVQFAIPLNARPVSTITNGKITTWTTGIDGGGKGDGYLTQSAALFNGDQAPHALPDDAIILANDRHPSIKLHYNNTDDRHSQTYNMSGEDSVEFTFTTGRYKAVYLALTSSEGPSDITVTFNYKYSPRTIKKVLIPDYYDDIKPDNQSFCYLVHDLAKWGAKNNMTENDHHNIDLLRINTSTGRYLNSISIKKGRRGYLVLWAAVGEVAGSLQ